ncbi:MAG: FtsX-like permease family protein, partial [Longimicrobiales bacterium]
YTPYTQLARQSGMFFYVRTAADPLRVAPLVRQAVASLDPDLPLRELKTMETQIDENLFAERLISKLTGIFAGLATVLAAVGLYGVLAFNVARRTREIGIRMALGASATNVRGLVVKEVAWMLLIGATAGIGSAAALAKFVRSMLYGMEPWDALVYGASAAVLGMIAVAAGYIPARRATRVDPVTALRYE